MAEQSLMQLKNLGLRSCNWLDEVGISDAETLQHLGSIEAFIRVKEAGFHPSLNLLYALEGAIADCHWTEVSDDRRSCLLQAIDNHAQSAA